MIEKPENKVKKAGVGQLKKIVSLLSVVPR